jgi:periplasmic protein TonB
VSNSPRTMKRALIVKGGCMADNLFAEPFVKIGGARKYTLPLSIVAHTLAIAAAIIVPVVATDTLVLPAQFSMEAFYARPPSPPQPPPPRNPAVEPSIAKPAVPIGAPQTIAPASPIRAIGEPLPEVGLSAGLISGGDYSAPPPPPSVPATAQVPVTPGGEIKRPVKVKDVVPIYPSIARAARVQGVVIVEATIGADGKVQNARILRSIPLLDAAALDAVRQWEYTPTLLNGTPIRIVMTVTVDFRLR